MFYGLNVEHYSLTAKCVPNDVTILIVFNTCFYLSDGEFDSRCMYCCCSEVSRNFDYSAVFNSFNPTNNFGSTIKFQMNTESDV